MPSVSAAIGDDRDTDYSSFEYQHLRFSPTIDSTAADGDSAFSESGSIDVLEDQGGLDSNEVAELVFMRRNVSIVIADFTEEAPVNQGNIQGEVAFGVNLDSVSDLPGDNTNQSGLMNEIDSTGVTGDAEATGIKFSLTADEVFDAASVVASMGFEDTVDTEIGGAGYDIQRSAREIPFRSMLGAGPVLDSGDNLSVVSEITKENAGIGRAELRYDVHCIFDIATVDDAGRRFGIPG